MTRLALLWHMHQPYYEDLVTHEHILPWVRLHAIKDYLGMVALLQEFPRVRVTFNLVPSLLVQVQAFAEDRARDRHLEIGLRPADRLDAAERAFLVANGFHAPVEHMIRPLPRYFELHARRKSSASFSTSDLRDLQVLHKLAWMDPDRLAADPRLQALIRKGRDFSEDDKQVLRAVELELLNTVIPAYRDAGARGQIELSSSPFYHPILPLLCDSDQHLRAHPHSAIPRALFSRPEDAREQVRRAMRFHASLFGAPPQGMWPSEGAVSDEVIAMLADEGCRWAATDETILARSLGQPVNAAALYRPYDVGSSGLRCLFRDHALSDRIGFTYQSWDADAAADDFLTRVRDAGGRAGRSNPVVTVILDGENAWEHYRGGGRPFLRALYTRLSAASEIATVTMAEAIGGPAGRLSSISSGSWIDGDFYIWAGHADDHRAWRQLADARAAFDAGRHDIPADRAAQAWEELLVAEGSDWFWWYGDDHSSDHDREFDDLFRRHLRNVYRALGLAVPMELYVSNITTDRSPGGPTRLRTRQSPVIDGRDTYFGEWTGSVPVSLDEAGGTMHRMGSHLVRELRLAADDAAIYLRLEGPTLVVRLSAGEAGVALIVEATGSSSELKRIDVPRAGSSGLGWAAQTIAELALPFDALGLPKGSSSSVRLSVLITDANGQVLEQYPAHEPLELELPGASLDAEAWIV